MLSTQFAWKQTPINLFTITRDDDDDNGDYDVDDNNNAVISFFWRWGAQLLII
jgi:hypothetical protein